MPRSIAPPLLAVAPTAVASRHFCASLQPCMFLGTCTLVAQASRSRLELTSTAAVPFQVHVPRHTCGASVVPARRGAQWYAHACGHAHVLCCLSHAWLPLCCCVRRALFRMRMCGALHCDDAAAALRAGAAKLIIALRSVVIGCTRRCEPCRGEHDAGGSHGDGTAARCARPQPPPLHAAAMGRLACACGAAQRSVCVESTLLTDSERCAAVAF